MNTLRPEIQEWIKKYCKIHNFRINGEDVPMEYTTRSGRIVDNNKFIYVTMSYKFHSKNYIYWDRVTKAFNYIYKISHFKDCGS